MAGRTRRESGVGTGVEAKLPDVEPLRWRPRRPGRIPEGAAIGGSGDVDGMIHIVWTALAEKAHQSHGMTRLQGGVRCILGPMFSGKTTELLRLHERHLRAQERCVLVKYAGDTRYDEECVATHDRKLGRGETVKARRLSEVRDRLFGPDIGVVSIDEGQFFDDLSDTVVELAAAGKTVYVAALNGDFTKKPFPQVSSLLAHIDEVTMLRAVCDCGSDALFSFRVTTDKSIVVIGGDDAYKAVCRVCYDKLSVERDQHDENLQSSSPLKNKTIVYGSPSKEKMKRSNGECEQDAKRIRVM